MCTAAVSHLKLLIPKKFILRQKRPYSRLPAFLVCTDQPINLFFSGPYTVALWKIVENGTVWSSTVFQTVRYMVSESTVSDGTFAHTTVFQMVFGYGIPTLR